MARLKRLVFFLVILLPVSASCGEFEDRYCIGTVRVLPYNFFSISFWAAPDDVMPFEQVYFFRDSLQDHLHFQFAMTGKDTAPSWFGPEIFKLNPEMKRLCFYCLQRQGNWARVIVNSVTGETKWVELGVDVRFEDWNAFFCSMGSIDILDGDGLLYESPKEKSKTSAVKKKAEAGNSQLISTKKVEGFWMQVEVIEFSEEHVETGRRTGWIRWKDETKMLVGYNLVPC